jgi:hypothetical protein
MSCCPAAPEARVVCASSFVLRTFERWSTNRDQVGIGRLGHRGARLRRTLIDPQTDEVLDDGRLPGPVNSWTVCLFREINAKARHDAQ